jgi:cytochrome b561
VNEKIARFAMMWRNARTSYGWVSIAVHWLAAVAIVALFGLGLWMTDLGYGHPWYNRAPALHEAVGMLVLALVLFRFGWRLATVTPELEPKMPRWERVAALGAHWLMYALMLAVLVSGYLISTAGGEAVDVFGWFAVPALVDGFERQADLAGWVHYYAAWALVLVAAGHTLAALKHHFIDRDRTLVRMLRPRSD